MNKMELLAPCGNMQSLITAVQYGADAVYFGFGGFNARRGAENFTKVDVQAAIDYCHTRATKVYIVLNTLVLPNEMDAALDLACTAALFNADALIVQDMGLVKCIQDHSNIPIHASTQMALHNLESVRLAKNLGIDRVVVARETPLKDIRHIKDNLDIEIEAFAHGALCAGFSGQCLFSSMTGGRSGNRGMCAQICRMPFSVTGARAQVDGYYLSPKDLCTIEMLNKMKNAGIDCLKIEGRLKRPEYVGVVTREYRQALDNLDLTDKISTDTLQELKQIFNRGNFTNGYYLGGRDIIFKDRPNHNGILTGKVIGSDNTRAKINLNNSIACGDGVEYRNASSALGGGSIEYIIKNGTRIQQATTGESVIINTNVKLNYGDTIYKTTDKNQIKRVAEEMRRERRKINIVATVTIGDRALELELVDQFGTSGIATLAIETINENIIELTDIDIQNTISKTGGTPFNVCEIIINRNSSAAIPRRLFNELRRQTVDLLIQNRIKHYADRYIWNNETNAEIPLKIGNSKPLLIVNIDDIKDADAVIKSGADEICIHMHDYAIDIENQLQTLLNNIQSNIIVSIYIPNIAFMEDMILIDKFMQKHYKYFQQVTAGGIFALQIAQKYSLECVADFTLNITNEFTTMQYLSMGFNSVNLSPELNASQLKAITNDSTNILCEYRIPLMYTVFCPRLAVDKNNCSTCNDEFSLQDKKGYVFPVSKIKLANCYNRILNAHFLSLYDKIKEVLSLKPRGIIIYPESNIAECVSAYRAAIDYKQYNNDDFNTDTKTTKGHYNRGVE